MIRPLALTALLAIATACSTPPVAAGLGTVPGVPLRDVPATATTAQCHVTDGRADRRCTPGALNPNVSQNNIHGTICVPGWTATIRPSASYTNRLKTQQMREYGVLGAPILYEEDHLLSLSAGGAPADPTNLWPEPRTGKIGERAKDKDDDEHTVQRDICAGRITLKQGQDQLLAKWSR